MIRQATAGAVLLPMIAGCTVGPDFHPPTMPLARHFVESDARPVGDVAQQMWWLDYGDATLNALVARGLAQNLDIRTALERISAAQAAARQTGLAGSVSGSAQVNSTQSINNSGNGQSSNGTFGPALVLDLFGGERRARESALADLEASRLDVGTARLAFLSSLATSYIDARYFQTALTITQANVKSRQETLDLAQQQRVAGTATDLDVAQAQATLDATRATLPSLESGFYASTYAIATLLAEPAQPLISQLKRGGAQPRPRGGSAGAGVPADLVRNRPDVRSAEQSFASATARIGVAEADLLPSISLLGSVSVAAGGAGWSFGPELTVPVLVRPRLKAVRDAAKSSARQSELAWRSSVLSAVEEVQAAQTAYIRNQHAISALSAAVDSYQRVVDLSEESYRGGALTLLDLLIAQRSLLTEQLDLAASVQALATNWAKLQVAAGRGWMIEGAGPAG